MEKKDTEKKPGLIETIKKVNTQDEIRKQEILEKKIESRREKYNRQIAEDKKELLKLKQGVIDESDSIQTSENTEVKYTLKQKFKNFIYHNKWWLGIVSFITVVAAFLIIDTVTTVRPDINIMQLSSNAEIISRTTKISELFSSYVTDYNDDDKNVANIISIPVSFNDDENTDGGYNGYGSVIARLSTQFEFNECMFIIADSAADAHISPELTLENLEDIFPDCPYVKGNKLFLKNTGFAELIGSDSQNIPDDLYIAVRANIKNLGDPETGKTNNTHALETLKAFIKDLNK